MCSKTRQRHATATPTRSGLGSLGFRRGCVPAITIFNLRIASPVMKGVSPQTRLAHFHYSQSGSCDTQTQEILLDRSVKCLTSPHSSHMPKSQDGRMLSSVQLMKRVSLVHVALTVYNYICIDTVHLHDPSSNTSDNSRESRKSRSQSRTSSVRSRARTRRSGIRTIASTNNWHKARSRSRSRLVNRRSISRSWRSGSISERSTR